MALVSSDHAQLKPATPDHALARFEVLADALDAREGDYLRARVLADGPDNSALRLSERLCTEIATSLGSEAHDFLDWLEPSSRGRKRVTLIVTARLALARERWDTVRRLASEVVARDHHDLLSQRLLDAAAEKSSTLETETDRWLSTRTCRAPFREMESRADGSVHFCCSAWQPVPIGSLTGTPGGFWLSSRAQEIRRSVLDGDFSYCSRWHCPAIASRRLPSKASSHAESAPAVPKGPERVILSHDRSCNISCPSCRTDVIALKHEATRRLDALFEEHLLPFVNEAKSIKVTGSGDPFGSRHFRYILSRLTDREHPLRRIQLHTNGLLANARAWSDLSLYGNVQSVWVSVDAARAETYAIIRRGGSFEELIPNLRFLGDLRKRGEIESFRLDFVVQKLNYSEMGAFVELAQSVGADGVYFLRLRNWGHFDADAFRVLDVCADDHPEHELLLDQLTDPRLAQRGVALGSMTAFVQKANARGASAFASGKSRA